MITTFFNTFMYFNTDDTQNWHVACYKLIGSNQEIDGGS